MSGDLRKRFVIGSAIALVALAVTMGVVLTRHLEEQTLIQTGQTSRDFYHYLIRHLKTPEELVQPKSPQAYEVFDELVHSHFFTPSTVSIKIYDSQSTLMYHSHVRRLVGQKFPDNKHLNRALQGETVVHFSKLHHKEHSYERHMGHKRLQEIYLPIIAQHSDAVIGAFELYVIPAPLLGSISKMKFFVWALIVLGLFGLNSNLYWIIRDASKSLARQQEIFRRNQELATLNAVGAVVNESLDLDEILSRALDMVLEVTKAESGEIFLWDEEAEALVQRGFRGLFPEAFQELTRFQLDQGFPGRIARTGESIVVHNLAEDARFLRGRVKQAGFQSFAGVPLRSKGKAVGVMGIASLDSERLTAEDVKLLAALGNQIGVAVENASLYNQLREMAVLEERQRLAREMHDGLAQELGYLHLKIGELEMGLASQPASSLLEELRQMKQVASSAYEGVRQAIFGLRMISRGVGLIPVLTEYLHEFSRQTGIDVELQIGEESATRFPHRTEVQLIRIIQEALTNVRKHAQASRVVVLFDAQEGKAQITIRDNGSGFDPDRVTQLGRPSFGLQTMRERAEAVDGKLKMTSQPGSGTKVMVWLPLEK